MENNKGNSVMDRPSNSATMGSSNPDVVLIGAGIMSATLAVMLKELDPNLNIEIYEVLGSAAEESTNAWNNAGTGHAALCELNYPTARRWQHRHFKGAGGQHRVRSLPSALGLPGEKGSDPRPSVLYSSRTPLQLRTGGGESRLSQEALCGAFEPSSLLRNGIFGGQETD
jgi:hypothetical protein